MNATTQKIALVPAHRIAGTGPAAVGVRRFRLARLRPPSAHVGPPAGAGYKRI